MPGRRWNTNSSLFGDGLMEAKISWRYRLKQVSWSLVASVFLRDLAMYVSDILSHAQSMGSFGP
jgi:hypothetical protein